MMERGGCELAAEAAGGEEALQKPGLDLDSWKGDLQRLHGTIDQVVQSFICGQTRQLDAVAAELTSQRERIVLKEQRFTELSDSIASFVEAEAARLEACGVAIGDPEAEARVEAYDAELPGPPALHRINRLWRKTTQAFEAMRASHEQQAAVALEDQRARLEQQVLEAEARVQAARAAHAVEVETLKGSVSQLQGAGQSQGEVAEQLSSEVQALAQALEAASGQLEAKVQELADTATAGARASYEAEVEREELARRREQAEAKIMELERGLADGRDREQELSQSCVEHRQKCEQMRRLMDDQEREMNQKIDRVQQYVKERQTGAFHAEKKQQDAERLAERWQSEVHRLQAEKDKLSKALLDVEGRSTGQSHQLQEAFERQQQEATALREALRRREEEMRTANAELLQQRDGEYQAKVSLEKQREKDRSIGLLKKKEQELHIKEQQLQAARRRVQELEGASAVGGLGSLSQGPGHAFGPRPGSAHRRGPSMGAAASGCGGETLPPLPLSAR